MLDWIKVKIFLKKNKFPTGVGFINCFKISIALLKKEENLIDIVNDGLEKSYTKAVLDIWRPQPTTKELVEKRKFEKILPDVFTKITPDLKKLQVKDTEFVPVSYKKLEPFFIKWDSTYKKALEATAKNAIPYSNPYLTIAVGESYKEGKKFQIGAKLGSSLEGSWGTWIEGVCACFNKKLIHVGAGRFDYILDDIAYDIKSGPRVLNLGQIDEIKDKRDNIKKVGNNSRFGKYVRVKDFKIAIVYGREELADVMKNQDFIIFGKDTWKILTGDEWNAYKTFLWNVQYKMSQSKWTKEELKESVIQFINSFYGDDDKTLKLALAHNEYKQLESNLSS